MATVEITGSALGTVFQQIVLADDIQPGAVPSYTICKLLYLFHPLGAKIVEKPIELAQSQKRDIVIPDSPETRLREAFEYEWMKVNANGQIANCTAQARIYGLASLALLIEGLDSDKPVDYFELWKQDISFNVYDPLNTAGSLVLNQNPLAMDFQHTTDIVVSGMRFHRSRTCVVMNEKPIYIAYTSSAFGFVGRSVYQRSLYPLKSFIQTMITDDMVSKKVGLIVAKIKQAGSIVNNAMRFAMGQRREVLKIAETGNVLSIGPEDEIASIDMQNLDGPHALTRKNIIENIASATPMPAKLLTEESFAEGFGEGTEDAKSVARYVDKVREQMEPLYKYFDRIVFHRAINPDFYKIIQDQFPEYADVPYKTAFYQWWNAFEASWPNLLKEPDSELVKVDEIRMRGVIAAAELLINQVKDGYNRAQIIKFVVDNFNGLKMLIPSPLELDYEAIENEEPPEAEGEEGEGGEEREPGTHEPKRFDSSSMDKLTRAVDALIEERAARKQARVDRAVKLRSVK